MRCFSLDYKVTIAFGYFQEIINHSPFNQYKIFWLEEVLYYQIKLSLGLGEKSDLLINIALQLSNSP